MKQDKMEFDEEERQILRDFERNEFESIRNFREEKRQLEEAARNTLQKDRPHQSGSSEVSARLKK